jgi:hypothetical protein
MDQTPWTDANRNCANFDRTVTRRKNDTCTYQFVKR